MLRALSRYALVCSLLLYMGGIFLLCALGLFPRAGLYDLSRLRGASVVLIEGKVLDSPLLRWGQTRFLMEAHARPLEAFGGRVVVTLPWLDATLAPGDRVTARGHLSRPTERARDYWASRRVYSFLKVWYAESFTVLRRSSRWSLARAAWRFQRRYRAFWEERLPERHAALLVGVTVGGRGILPADLKEACIRAGVYHIMVVSGQNMSLIVNLGLVLLLALAVPRRHAFWICLPLVIFYTVAVGSDPPVVRAAISALVGLLVSALGRDIPSYYPLCMAAAWILIREPEALLGASFQLSFAATLSIYAIHPFHNKPQGWWPRMIGWLVESALLGLFVYMGIWPLLVAYFHRLSFAGVCANWTLFPLSGILMVLGLVIGTWGVCAPHSVPAILVWLMRQGVEWMLTLIERMAGWSWVVRSLDLPPPWVLGLYYGGLFGILFLAHRRKKNEKSRPHLQRR